MSIQVVKQKIISIIFLILMLFTTPFFAYGNNDVNCNDPKILKVLRWMIVNRMCNLLSSYCPINYWDKLAVVIDKPYYSFDSCITTLVVILGHDKNYQKDEGWRGFKIKMLNYKILRGARINTTEQVEEELFLYLPNISANQFIPISEEKTKQLLKYLYAEEILFDYEKK